MNNDKNDFPSFINRFRRYKASPSPMTGRQKFPFADILKGECLEIEAKTWPAETMRNPVNRKGKVYTGSSNVASAAYAYGNNHGIKIKTAHMPNGNVIIYNLGEK